MVGAMQSFLFLLHQITCLMLLLKKRVVQSCFVVLLFIALSSLELQAQTERVRILHKNTAQNAYVRNLDLIKGEGADTLNIKLSYSLSGSFLKNIIQFRSIIEHDNSVRSYELPCKKESYLPNEVGQASIEFASGELMVTTFTDGLGDVLEDTQEIISTNCKQVLKSTERYFEITKAKVSEETSTSFGLFYTQAVLTFDLKAKITLVNPKNGRRHPIEIEAKDLKAYEPLK